MRISELEPIRPLIWSKLAPQSTKGSNRNFNNLLKSDSLPLMKSQESDVIKRMDATRNRIAKTYKYRKAGRSQ